ncbi:hypothetical protein [Dyadobacter sp.]|uniref:hypothetical protein n=1 Tax=Dyadobacter sp. TaxID=1914288 RepID=UPI003F6FE0E9
MNNLGSIQPALDKATDYVNESDRFSDEVVTELNSLLFGIYRQAEIEMMKRTITEAGLTEIITHFISNEPEKINLITSIISNGTSQK